MKHGTELDIQASAPVDFDHEGHVRKYQRQRAVRHSDMMRPRKCDACHGVICCYYGEKTVESPGAPCGVWILHPLCSPPKVGVIITEDWSS